MTINTEQKPSRTGIIKAGALVLLTILAFLMIFIRSQNLANQREHYQTIVQEGERIKALLEPCLTEEEQFSTCKPGTNGIPKQLLTDEAQKSIEQISILDNGVILIKPKPLHGIRRSDIYQLVPHKQHHSLEWSTIGTSIERGLANQYH